MEKLVEFLLKLYPLDNVPFSRRVQMHFIFWLIWGAIYYLAVISGVTWEYRLWATLTSIFRTALIYYALAYFILSNFTEKNKLILALQILVLYVGFWYMLYLFYKYAIDNKVYNFKSKYYDYMLNYVQSGTKELYNTKDLFFELFYSFQGVAPIFLLKVSRLMAISNQKSIKLEKEKTELELIFLRLQLNPHFLLNTLNNIYSQVISKQENASQAILTLADLLSYILYEASSEKVPLKQEIKFLRDYMDLEKLRNSDNVKISFEIEGDMKGLKIVPLILISFVENAFKHGISDSTLPSYIDLQIKISEETQQLNFIIKNSKPRVERVRNLSQGGGIGLVNTRKRLEMVYPDRHSLIIKNEQNFFLVSLSMNL